MTQDELISIAKDAGCPDVYIEWAKSDWSSIKGLIVPMTVEQLSRFAKLVAAKAIAELESQEPVAWMRTSGIGSPVVTNEMFNAYPEMRWSFETPLYTHPPQRKPLTDEQVEKIIKANMSFQMNLAGIRQDFEAAHDIKE